MALLKIEKLTHFFGGLRSVNNFNLELSENELVGLIGPNGAGKSTIFNLICGLYRPTEGSIMFNGNNLIGRYPHQITSLGIGRTFQNIRLWNELSVIDNLRIAHFSQINYKLQDSLFFTKRLVSEEQQVSALAMDLLDKFNLSPYINELPRSLPYGIQRRVEICRALVVNPSLMLLDEPAAGMN